MENTFKKKMGLWNFYLVYATDKLRKHKFTNSEIGLKCMICMPYWYLRNLFCGFIVKINN